MFTEGRKRKEITTLMFTDSGLPMFIEGGEKRHIITLTFTNSELPTFTKGSKKITITNFHCRFPTNFH